MPSFQAGKIGLLLRERKGAAAARTHVPGAWCLSRLEDFTNVQLSVLSSIEADAGWHRSRVHQLTTKLVKAGMQYLAVRCIGVVLNIGSSRQRCTDTRVDLLATRCSDNKFVPATEHKWKSEPCTHRAAC